MLHLYITLDERKKNKDVSNLKYNQLIHMMKKKMLNTYHCFL